MNKQKRLPLFLHKYWFHLIIWVIMILFFFVAPGIRDYKTITEGKPVEIAPISEKSTDLIRYSIDRIDPYLIKGQNIYDLWGWSYISDDKDQSNYDIYIVLKSGTREYYYLSESISRPELNKAFPDVNIDLANSGFVIYLSKEFIAHGRYDIGILYHQKTSGDYFYQQTNKQLIRTPNKLKIELKPTKSGK